MIILVSISLFLIFLFLSLIHFYWSAGGQWGKDAAIPSKKNNIKAISPGVLSTFIVGLGFLAFGIFILIKANLLHIPIPLLIKKNGLWFIAIIFIIRAIGEFKYIGFFKKIRCTKFGEYDTMYYSPLSLLIGILSIILELNT